MSEYAWISQNMREFEFEFELWAAIQPACELRAVSQKSACELRAVSQESDCE